MRPVTTDSGHGGPNHQRRGGDERRCRDLPRNRFKRTPAAGPSARVRPREKNGGGGKAGNRDDETWHDAREDWGGEKVAYEETKTGGHEDKAREGSSTPAIETPAVGASADVRPRVAGGGGEGTKATTDEGAERSIQGHVQRRSTAQENEHGIPRDACGRAGQEGRKGVPRAKRQHRRLWRTPKQRAPTRRSGKKGTLPKGGTR